MMFLPPFCCDGSDFVLWVSKCFCFHFGVGKVLHTVFFGVSGVVTKPAGWKNSGDGGGVTVV